VQTRASGVLRGRRKPIGLSRWTVRGALLLAMSTQIAVSPARRNPRQQQSVRPLRESIRQRTLTAAPLWLTRTAGWKTKTARDARMDWG